jgi:hypothetical protein
MGKKKVRVHNLECEQSDKARESKWNPSKNNSMKAQNRKKAYKSRVGNGVTVGRNVPTTKG